MSNTKAKEIETLTKAIKQIRPTLQFVNEAGTVNAVPPTERAQPLDEAAYAVLEAQLLGHLRPIEAEEIWQEAKAKLLATLSTEGLVNSEAYTSQILSRAKRRIQTLAQAENDRRRFTQQEPVMEMIEAKAETTATTEAATTPETPAPKQEPQATPASKTKAIKPKKAAAKQKKEAK